MVKAYVATNCRENVQFLPTFNKLMDCKWIMTTLVNGITIWKIDTIQ